jgi:WD40 repeat protein
MVEHSIYTTGGTVQVGGGIYLARQADAELLAMCQSGAFAYILTSRQMGKSSLMVQTATRLSQVGIRSATVDLSMLGAQATAEQWYLGFLVIIEEQLDLETNVVQWWQERPHLGLTQRMTQFFQEILLAEIEGQMVIFVDEIDSTLSLNFTDDFFAAIRYFYVARSQEPAFHRLSFVLIGVAAPSDLIRDKSRTPFNIGREIILAGFQIAEVQPLMAGLVDRADDPPAVLSAVLAWTGGQPFLTQKLCQLIIDSGSPIAAGHEVVAIDQLVRSRILENWETQDQPEHLRTIRDRLLSGGEQRSGRRLGLCQQIVQQGEVTADESPEQQELCLTGLVVKQQGRLHIYNRIYAEVFNLSWFEQKLAELRPYGNELSAWVASNLQDESRLLRGKALQEALAWASGRSLGDVDYRFFNASQEVEQRVAQEENRILEAARQKAETKTKKANRRLGWSSLFALVLVVFALLFSFTQVEAAKQQVEAAKKEEAISEKARDQAKQEAIVLRQETNTLGQKVSALDQKAKLAERQALASDQKAKLVERKALASQQEADRAKSEAIEANRDRQRAQIASEDAKEKQQISEAIAQEEQAKAVLEEKKVQIAQTANRLERQGTATLKQFESQPIPALISSIKIGEELKDLLRDNQISKLIDYPTTSPLLALQTILDNIQLQNILDFPKDRGSIRSTEFSPDGQYIVTTYQNSKAAYVLNLLKQQEIELAGDKDIGTTGASFSPDGQYILTTTASSDPLLPWLAAKNATARVWKLSGQQQAKLVTKTHNKFSKPSFSPDGRHIIAISEAGTALIWDLSKQQGLELEAIEIKEDQTKLTIAKFSSNNQHVVTASENESVQIWNQSGQQLSSFKDIGAGGDCSISDLTTSPNGQHIAISRINYFGYYLTCGSVTRIRDLSGQLLTEFKDASSASFSPDSRFVAGADLVWDLSTRRQQVKLRGEKSETLKPSFTPNGKYIVTTDSNTTHLWDLSGEKVRDFEGQFVKFSPDSQHIWTSSGLWDFLSGQKIAKIYGAKSQDNKRITTIDSGRVLIWNFLNQPPSTIEGIAEASFSSDSRQIVTRSGRPIDVWSLSGQHLNQLSQASGSECGEGVIFSLDSQTFDSFSRGDFVCIWNLSRGRQTSKFEVNDKIYNSFIGRSLGFSSDGQRILTISDGTVWMWDLPSGRELGKFELKGQKGNYESVALSPNNQLIATRSDDSTTRIWDLSGQQLAEFKEDQSRITTNAFRQKYAHYPVEQSLHVNILKRGVAVHGENKISIFSPDGRHIVTQSSDRSIAYVWDLLTGKSPAILKGHQAEIVSVSFSPDGQRILTASLDATARIWNLAGQQLAEFNSPDKDSPDKTNRFFADASFSPDGQHIMAAGAYRVFIWQTGDLNQLLVRGCTWLKDYLASHPDAPKICQNSQVNS